MRKQILHTLPLALLAVLVLAGCYVNPGPAGLTPIPTLAPENTAQPAMTVVAQATGAGPATAPTQGAATAPAQGAATPAQGTTAAPAATAPAQGTAAAPVAGPGNAQNGATLYQTNCVACHGANAQGGVGPALRNNKFVQGDAAAVFATIANGRPGTAMPPWSKAKGGQLTDQQINDLVAYLKTLQ